MILFYQLVKGSYRLSRELGKLSVFNSLRNAISLAFKHIKDTKHGS